MTNAIQQQQNNEVCVQQNQRINEILADSQAKNSVNGSGEISKKSAGDTTADSIASKNAVNAERAARHARRLQKASSQGAQNPALVGHIDEVHKVRIVATGNEDGIKRKAGSGTRVEQKVAET